MLVFFCNIEVRFYKKNPLKFGKSFTVRYQLFTYNGYKRYVNILLEKFNCQINILANILFI